MVMLVERKAPEKGKFRVVIEDTFKMSDDPDDRVQEVIDCDSFEIAQEVYFTSDGTVNPRIYDYEGNEVPA